jgi:hypothetical protein
MIFCAYLLTYDWVRAENPRGGDAKHANPGRRRPARHAGRGSAEHAGRGDPRDTQGGARETRGGYPLTEPDSIPRMNWRWNTKLSTMIGSETSIAAADSRLICTR